MRKAFDTVLHEAMLVKLLKANINGKFYKSLKSMYENTRISAKVNKHSRTELFKSEVCIRQGDNLSPTLFKIIMDELPKELVKDNCSPVILNKNPIPCLLYADDIVLMSETPEGLQEEINKTKCYGEKHGLEMNTNKTKTMFINKKSKMSKIDFKLNSLNLEEVKEYKYLGLLISSSGSINNLRSNLYNVATKAMYKMRRYVNNSQLSVPTMMHLFDTLISPIVLYGCEISNIFNVTKAMKDNKYKYIENIFKWKQEKLHLNFCKYTLGVNSKTTTMAVLGELGRYPLYIKALKLTLKYHQRCKDKMEGTLVKDAYLEMLSDSTHFKWTQCIEYILNKFDYKICDIGEYNI